MEVRGVTPERVDEVEDASVNGGTIDANGNLVLSTVGGAQKNAGKVVVPLAAWPVGSVYIGTTSTDPSVLFGGGTWQSFGAGRVLVGIDPTQPEFDSVLETGGSKTHTLTAAQSGMPSHNHGQDPHDHAVNPFREGYPIMAGDASANAAWQSGLSIPTGVVGALDIAPTTATNQAAPAQNAASSHPILQPYIVVYMWRRTA